MYSWAVGTLSKPPTGAGLIPRNLLLAVVANDVRVKVDGFRHLGSETTRVTATAAIHGPFRVGPTPAMMEPIPPWTEALSAVVENYREIMMEAVREILRELDIPGFSSVVEAAAEALQDARRAFRSSYVLLVLVGRPIFVLLRLILRPVLLSLWAALRMVCGWLAQRLLPWVLRNGGAKVQSLAVAAYDFHKQRTPKELLLESAIIGCIVVIYKLYRVVQHHRWVARTRRFVSQKIRALEQWCHGCWAAVVTKYRCLVNRVAEFSQVCAAALPHALYWSTAALLSYWLSAVAMRPFGSDVKVLVYLATQTPLIPLLQVGYPLVETLACIWHDDEDASDNGARISKDERKKKASQKHRRHNHHRKLESVLDYWTLHAAQRLAGAAVSCVPFASRYVLNSAFVGVAYLWWSLYVSALLYMSCHHSETHGHANADASGQRSTRGHRASPDQQSFAHSQFLYLPASWLVQRVGAGASELNGIVSMNTWHHLLSVIVPFVDLSVSARLVTRGTRDQVVNFLTELRVIVVPLVMCFAPLVSSWAVRFPQFVIPISKFHGHDPERRKQRAPTPESTDSLVEAAQYWVLHLCVAGFLTPLLPFSVLRFLAWWYLSWPTTIRWLWGWCGCELVAVVDVLLGEAPLTDSAIWRALHGLGQRLPRAESACSIGDATKIHGQAPSSDGLSTKAIDNGDDISYDRENAPPSRTNSEPRRSQRKLKRSAS